MTRAMIIFCLAIAVLPQRPLAQSSASFQIPRNSVDGGAAPASSASYQLSGTLAQPDAEASSSASFRLQGGFHKPATNAVSERIFANGLE